MEPASELEELKEMAEVAVFHNKKQGSRWWKQECNRIREKWRLKRQLALRHPHPSGTALPSGTRTAAPRQRRRPAHAAQARLRR